MNSGRILTLKVLCQLNNGCVYAVHRRGPSVVHLGSALAFYAFAYQAAVDSNEVTETKREDESEGTVPVVDGCTFRGVAQLIGPWMVTEELVPNRLGCWTVYC